MILRIILIPKCIVYSKDSLVERLVMVMIDGVVASVMVGDDDDVSVDAASL
jgi:hypothetical protein